MHARHRNRPWSILLAVVIAATFVGSCVVPTPVAPEPTGIAPTSTPVTDLPELMRDPDAYCRPLEGSEGDKPQEAIAGSHFVLNQVILSGPTDRFNESNLGTWKQQLQEEGIELIPLRKCDLGILGSDTPQDPVGALSEFSHPDERPLSQPFKDLPDWRNLPIETRLYKVNINRDDLTFVQAVPIITQIVSRSSNGEGKSFVFTDPNYLVGPQEGGMPCADPEVTEANPFTVGGSPFTVGGSAGAPSGAEASPEIFWEQWALKEIDVEKPGEGNALLGTGAVVVVFDTSPFEESTSSPVPMDSVTPALNLYLRYPAMVNSLAPRPAKSQDVRNHGLFAAGLVHAVAPGSKIYLVRVLNEYGCSDLFTLATAISGVTQSLKELPPNARPARIVYNLSLGVPQPSEDELKKQNWQQEINLLEEAVNSAFDSNVVVVAAAGNESTPPGPPAQMQAPAYFKKAIGVAASTRDKTASCYTNNGKVGAPGADGGPKPAGDGSTEVRLCAPLADQCGLMEWDCPWGVVSLSLASSTGYQFWAGTSFAAPLVSGLAAALLAPPPNLPNPTAVMNRTYARAAPPPTPQSQLGVGIMSVPASLTQ